jgi:anionic cell wall polymer biosynthesis LytR-Cps2A-Psr (LCP) family protein
VNQYLILDLDSFKAFINAMGGVDVNVPRPLPVGGHEENGREVGVKYYIPAGRQHLMGQNALWFARSRSDSDDFARMGRQRCLIGAVSQQADPLKLAQSFPSLARSFEEDISTSIKLDDLSAWVTLLLRVKGGHIRSLPFTNSNIKTSNPDFDYIRTKVKAALAAPAPKPAATGSTSSGGTKKPSAKPSTTSDPGAAVDVKQAC